MRSEASTAAIAASAAHKFESGALMTIEEVGALLDLAPATVHRLSLPSIRLGRSLRFDPLDVRRLIESHKESVISIATNGIDGKRLPHHTILELEGT